MYRLKALVTIDKSVPLSDNNEMTDSDKIADSHQIL